MRNWKKMLGSWGLMMVFCAVSAWSFDRPPQEVTAVYFWAWIAAMLTAMLGVLWVWDQ